MIVKFNSEKKYLLFTPETLKERANLREFPGLMKVGMEDGCPAILPVAYNIVERLKKILDVKMTVEVRDWLNSNFKLLPLPNSFKYHTTPKEFQDIALRFIYTVGSAGLLLEPGMGKTKVVLDYILLKNFSLSLVACPAALLFVWEDETKIHRPELFTYVVRTTDWKQELSSIRAAQQISKNVVIVINYEKVVILKHRIKELKLDYFHLDEFLIKDPSTTRTSTMLEISKQVPYRSGGSGTLINNSPLDEFSPIRFLQPALVGCNYGVFQERYCVLRDMEIGSSGKKARMPVAYKNVAEMRSILDSCCIVMTKEKWLKLPAKTTRDIYVQMSPEQKEVYYGLMRNYYVHFKGMDIKVDNPLVMLAKLFQISQGFIYAEEEEPTYLSESLLGEGSIKKKLGPRQTLFFPESPKIAALEKLLTETLSGKKAIIWFNLSAEFTLIKSLLERLGHKYLAIQGGDKRIGDKVREFNTNPSIPWLVCQAKSVNYGITVLGSKSEDLEKSGIEVLPNLDPSVHTEIFLSMNFSLEVYSQQEDRIHRLGQEHNCDYYRIFCNNPVESKIRQALTDKINIRREMLVDIAASLLQEEDPLLGTVNVQ